MNLRYLAVCGAAALAVLAGAQSPTIEKIHDGAHWTWYARSDQFDAHKADIEAMYDYADKAFAALENAWGLKPKESKYSLFVWDKTGGGFAAGDIGEVHTITGKESPGVACSYDAFFNVAHGIKGYWAPVLITHEMVNLFTGQIVSGGWPRDWWADDRSPFPYVTSVEIELGLWPQVGVDHLEEGASDPQIQMFLHLKDQYGWQMFRRAFQMAIGDGIQWDRFGGNPSALRTNYVAAYLEMGAGESLKSMMDGPVPNYDHSVVAQIIAARKRWQAHRPGNEAYKAAGDAYLSGKYADVK